MRVLVIGGTGAFSTRITERATELGHEVLVCTRGRRPLPDGLGARLLMSDRAALRDRASELQRWAPDVVVDSICFDPVRAEDLVALFSSARRVVLISTVDVYGEDVGGAPVTEARRPEPVSPYAKAKLACERVVFEGLGARATVFRPSHILGRAFLTASLWGRSPHLVDRIRRGLPVPAIDGGRNLMTPIYARDAAEWVVRSFDQPAADGQVFNAVGGEIITQRRYYECIARALGAHLRTVPVPAQVFKRHFATPPQFNWHRPYSCDKAVATFGYAPLGTPELMLEETVQSMLDAGLVKDAAEQPFDDALVELLVRHEAELDQLLSAMAPAPR
jgi:nucleoside-diphosphate-sugar epimerase